MDLDLVRRAALHAALGDRHRLAIVDTLACSDRSPAELADSLGIASNLVAHHLGVLEGLDVVRRVVSEGDRRKRYVQLVPDGLSGLHPKTAVSAQRVVFVCTENSARSQLAEALWNATHTVKATSAGIDPASDLHPGTFMVAARRGLDLGDAHTKGLPAFSDRDLIISVCDRAHDALTKQDTLHQLHWSIPDPVPAGSAAAFEQAFDVIVHRVAAFAPRVQTSEHPAAGRGTSDLA